MGGGPVQASSHSEVVSGYSSDQHLFRADQNRLANLKLGPVIHRHRGLGGGFGGVVEVGPAVHGELNVAPDAGYLGILFAGHEPLSLIAFCPGLDRSVEATPMLGGSDVVGLKPVIAGGPSLVESKVAFAAFFQRCDLDQV